MWYLEHDSDLFEHKRLWLKPGTSHLLGRTKNVDGPNEQAHFISNKSVSRKHLAIQIYPVEEGSARDVYTRSKVVLTDGSKLGSSLDGEKFVKESRELTKEEHRLNLGSWDQAFKIKWQPVVFTFTESSKSKTAYEEAQRKLEPLDIKTILEYLPGQTTHVVHHKRNTPRCLQALANGKFIVTEDYVDAVHKAAEPQPNPAGPAEPDLSPLEIDFDAGWPKEADYLPPPGNEPIPRPAEFFKPDPERAELFSGYTFVFGSQDQFDSLQPPITNAGGKALLFDVVPGETTVDVYVRYIRNAAGKKGIGEFINGKGGKGVVVVRLLAKKHADWVTKFDQEVDLALNQRSMQQNEFLDVLLTKDTSGLRKPLEIDMVPSTSIQQAAGSPDASQAAQRRISTSTGFQNGSMPSESSQSASNPADIMASRSNIAKRGRRAVTTSRRFKGFDDFDVSQLPKTQIGEEDDQDMPDILQSAQKELTQASENGSIGGPQAQQSTRKRKDPPSDDDVEMLEGPSQKEGGLSALFPAAAAMKRRKLEAQKREGNTVPPKPEPSQPLPRKNALADELEALQRSRKKITDGKDIDVLGEAKKRRDREEEEAQRDAEALEKGLEGINIEDLRNLVQVEEMEVPDRPRRPVDDDRNHWHPRWNGRKNFKKFRKARPGQREEDGLPRRRPQRAFVSLEEVPKQSAGIGEHYWLTTPEHTQSQSQHQQTRHSRSQSQAQRSVAQEPSMIADSVVIPDDSDSASDGPTFRRRGAAAAPTASGSRRSGVTPTAPDAEDQVSRLEPEELAGVPRDSGLARDARQTRAHQRETQRETQGSSTLREATPSTPGKRKATAGSAQEPAAKRARGAPATTRNTGRRKAPPVVAVGDSEDGMDDDDDDDDGLKFRMRRRR